MRVRRFFARVLVCMMALFLAWGGGLFLFSSQIPERPSENTEISDAIVVLTGGSGRIAYGLKLLAENKAKALFISGAREGITRAQILAQAPKETLNALKGRQDAIVIIGFMARNTIGNALEVAQWMRREDLKTIRLVTANYHMPRSLAEFRELMPDIAVVADPVVPENFNTERWLFDSASRKLVLSEYHKYILGRVRHALIAAVEDR